MPPIKQLLSTFAPDVPIQVTLRLRERVPRPGIVRSDADNAPAQFNDCGLVFRVLSFLQLVSQLLKLRRFLGGESAASQQNKNDDGERSQVIRDLGHRDAEVQAFSGGFRALPVRRKLFPLGQSLNTSHRLQSGLRA